MDDIKTFVQGILFEIISPFYVSAINYYRVLRYITNNSDIREAGVKTYLTEEIRTLIKTQNENINNNFRFIFDINEEEIVQQSTGKRFKIVKELYLKSDNLGILLNLYQTFKDNVTQLEKLLINRWFLRESEKQEEHKELLEQWYKSTGGQSSKQ